MFSTFLLLLLSTFFYNTAATTTTTTTIKSAQQENHVNLVQHISTFEDPLIVPTKIGPVRGVFIPSFTAVLSRAFLGIPFADPPKRFAAPVKFSSPWGGFDPINNHSYGIPRPCITPAPVCPQLGLEWNSEDCLYLNIYTPSLERIKTAKKRLPVMFWIFGGAFYIGSGSTYSMYDGKYLVNHHDVIVVTHNYRLGAFGFLTTRNSDGTEYSGNVGIQDQSLALEWIKQNIEYFGGDPNHITVIGESAGALSTAIHLTSSPMAGIDRAILESPPLGIYMRTHEEALIVGQAFAKNLSCFHHDLVNASCLAKKSTLQILLAQRYIQPSLQEAFRPLSDVFWWWPHVDGRIIKENPFQIWSNGGDLGQVPIIIGTTKDETALFSVIYDIPVLSRLLGLREIFQKSGYENHIKEIFQDDQVIGQVFQQYPSHKNDDDKNEVSFINLTTDYLFSCPSLLVAKQLAQAKKGNVFLYEFSHIPSYLPFAGKCFKKHVCHATDLPYLWRPGLVTFKPNDLFVSNAKIDLWMKFMSHSSNLTSLPGWSALNNTHPEQYYNLNETGLGMRSGYRANACTLWNSKLGYNW